MPHNLIEEHLTGTRAECRRMIALVREVTGKDLNDWSPEEWDQGLLTHLITPEQARVIARRAMGGKY